MNTLHIIDSLGLGGAQMIVKGIAENSDNSIFVFSCRQKIPSIIIEHTHVFSYPSYQKYNLGTLLELRNLIKNNNISLLHCHLTKSQIFGFILKKIWFPDIHLVFHEHGDILAKKWWFLFFLTCSKNIVNAWIAPSQAIVSCLQKQGIHIEKIHTIPNFLDPILANAPFHKKTNSILHIGFLGRLSYEKGTDVLLSALSHLQKNNFSFHALIGGVGPEQNALEIQAKKLGIENHVSFLGYISDKVSFYESIDILIVPSRRESFGLTALEAQYFGIPVIASNIEGLSELIQNTKYLFELENSEQLFESIKYYYVSDKKVINNTKIIFIKDFILALQKIYSSF